MRAPRAGPASLRSEVPKRHAMSRRRHAERPLRSVVAVRRLVERRALKHRATGGPEPGREREAQRHDHEGSKPFSACGGHAARIARKGALSRPGGLPT
jgi:hypothetical protein